MGGAPNVTILAFPHGLFADFPCNGGASGCRNGLDRFNWTAPGAPLLTHRVRRPEYVSMALQRLRSVPFSEPHVAVDCGPMRSLRRDVKLACGKGWSWCAVPFKAAPTVKRQKRKQAPRPSSTHRNAVERTAPIGGQSSGRH